MRSDLSGNLFCSTLQQHCNQDGAMWEYTMIYGFVFGLIKRRIKNTYYASLK